MSELFRRLADQLSLEHPINVYLAGGMAVHLYTSDRVTTDVDAEFSARVHIPTDLVVDVQLADGTAQAMYFDTNYNPAYSLLHEGYVDAAIPLDMGVDELRLFVLSPVDLAVSKIARLADIDKHDIAALVSRGLTNADEISFRAEGAMIGFVGGREILSSNLHDAVAVATEAERSGLSHRSGTTLT